MARRHAIDHFSSVGWKMLERTGDIILADFAYRGQRKISLGVLEFIVSRARRGTDLRWFLMTTTCAMKFRASLPLSLLSVLVEPGWHTFIIRGWWFCPELEIEGKQVGSGTDFSLFYSVIIRHYLDWWDAFERECSSEQCGFFLSAICAKGFLCRSGLSWRRCNCFQLYVAYIVLESTEVDMFKL